MRQPTGQDTIYLNLEGGETTTHVTALMVVDQLSAPGAKKGENSLTLPIDAPESICPMAKPCWH